MCTWLAEPEDARPENKGGGLVWYKVGEEFLA